jgi:hypothetical protein
MALEEKIDGPLGGADVHHRKLRLGQGIKPEAGQDVIIEGPVGFPGIDQNPVTVVDDHLEQWYFLSVIFLTKYNFSSFCHSEPPQAVKNLQALHLRLTPK